MRYLKKITLLCIVMNIIITAAVLVLCLRTGTVDAGVVAALLGAWSIELGLGAIIKVKEKKDDDGEDNV